MIIQTDHPYQTRQQVEELFQVSPATIYRWVKAGDFPKPIRLGANMVRWKSSEIYDWASSKEPKQ